MDKIKEFFEKKTVKIVEAVVIAIGSAGLIIGSVSIEQIQTIPVLVSGILLAVEALISFIQALTKKE